METGVLSDTALNQGGRTRLIPISDISIAHGDKNVKRESFDTKAKQETGVMDDTILENQASTRLLPVTNINIARLIENINPSDEKFFKYMPDELLNTAQLEAKRRALESINKDEIVKQEDAKDGVARQYSPSSDISISRLIENINPSDENFFKYDIKSKADSNLTIPYNFNNYPQF